MNLVIWRDSDPDHPSSFRFAPFLLILFWLLTIAVGTFIVGVFLYVTPIGDQIFNREDEHLRAELVALSQRVLAIQDSLDTRDAQLDNIKQILYDGSDTTFVINRVILFDEDSLPATIEVTPTVYRPMGNINTTLAFPLRFPVKGTLSQSFKPQSGHFGIDLSATTGDPIYASADGAIISSEWTLNFGYVIKIQHADGYLSVLKHADRPVYSEGKIVRKGDLLGFISNTGIISTGPHLHIELWKDGVPLDPEFYFTQR